MNAWLALGLYALFMLLAFGVRTWVQLRRTGSTGFKGISGRPGSAEWLGGVLFVVAVVLGVVAPVLDLLAVLPRMHATEAATYAGLVVACAGIAATFVAQTAMGSSWRIGVDATERTALVVEGPFRLVRNPIFTCMLVTALGLALVVPNAVSLGGFLLLLVAVEIQVRFVEEPYLRRVHGEAYARYAGMVGRFVPFFGRT